MMPGSPFALVNEMLEAPAVLRGFDPGVSAHWATEISKNKRLFITGEGSSRIFCGKNLIDQSMRHGADWHIRTEGARQAAEYDLSSFVVLAATNSGRTRELVVLFEKLAKENITRYGVVGTPGTRLTELATECRLLTCGDEKAVASSKSVIEQALIYQSLLGGGEWKDQAKAADFCADILDHDVPADITGQVKNAPVIYLAGRNNGVAEELTLKTNEIARRKSDYLEGTYVLHGIEEVMQAGETVILIDPFPAEMEKYQTVLKNGVGVNVVAIASFDTPFPTIKIPALPGFDAYFQLLAGWNILIAAGLANGINLDKPVRARKIGNAI